MTTEAKTKQVWRPFTAVDFVTIAVFAAIYRATWYIWHAFGMIAPFNQIINAVFSVGAIIAVMVIVRKLGAAMLFSIAAQAINLFLQGEAIPAALVYLSWGLLADIYVWIRLAAGADPFSNLGDMMIATVLTAIIRSASDWLFAFPYVFLTPIPPAVMVWIFPTHVLGGIFGGWGGWHLGNRLRGLIG